MINNQCQFEPSTNTSSATTCKWCGQEKWQHNKTIRNNKQTAVEWLESKMPTAFKELTINKELIKETYGKQ